MRSTKIIFESAGVSATNLQMFFTITLLSSIPYILAGLRISIGRAIVGVVVAEFFMFSKGLGYFINVKANALEMAPAFVAIVLSGLFRHHAGQPRHLYRKPLLQLVIRIKMHHQLFPRST